MQVAEIELYKVLKTKFSENEAETIVANLELKIQGKFDERKNDFATKEDLANLKVEMERAFKDQLKWMFIFWIGQLASFIAIAKFIFHQ